MSERHPIGRSAPRLCASRSPRPRSAVPLAAACGVALLAALASGASAALAAGGWMFHGAGPERLTLEIPLDRPPGEIATGKSSTGLRTIDVECLPGALPWSRQQLGHPLVEAVLAETTPDGLRLAVVPGPRLGRVEASAREGAPGIVVRFSASDSGSKGGGVERAAEAARVGAAGVEPASTDAPLRFEGLTKSAESRTIVIDPGHGGAEEGAVGPGGLVEKDLVLDVARRLLSELRAQGHRVLLTRSGDDDVPLDERAAIANEHNADLFVSLHANASRFAKARGAETYFLSPEATDDEARTLAALENDAVAAATLTPARTSDSRPASAELPLILWDLAQVGYLEESARLAETIQERLNRELDIADRGVRQAPFRVLVGATCPAVLVELGFLTNPAEERLLATVAYRRRLASALADAIRTFRTEPERTPKSGSLGAAP